mmetsp:Transcript_31227/g.81875  ORF Transcript_31227/g.81875 Transcript_31227/m.81875 type:complete len:202 (+) Transcript_31227:142-747(+)
MDDGIAGGFSRSTLAGAAEPSAHRPASAPRPAPTSPRVAWRPRRPPPPGGGGARLPHDQAAPGARVGAAVRHARPARPVLAPVSCGRTPRRPSSALPVAPTACASPLPRPRRAPGEQSRLCGLARRHGRRARVPRFFRAPELRGHAPLARRLPPSGPPPARGPAGAAVRPRAQRRALPRRPRRRRRPRGLPGRRPMRPAPR